MGIVTKKIMSDNKRTALEERPLARKMQPKANRGITLVIHYI